MNFIYLFIKYLCIYIIKIYFCFCISYNYVLLLHFNALLNSCLRMVLGRSLGG